MPAAAGPNPTTIESLRAGAPFSGTFVLRRHELRQTRTGKAFLDMELGDATGALSAKLWDAGPDAATALEGVDYVDVDGRVEVYKERRQLSLTSIRPAQGAIDPLRFLPRTDKNLRELFKTLGQMHRTIACPYLRQLIKSFLGDEPFRRRFLLAPAAASNHHAYLGGLLEHVVSLSQACLKTCEAYPDLDRDLLLAGAFFHDIGKVDELTIGKKLGYSDRGRLVGHIVTGVLWVEARARAIPGFPEDTLDHLKHLILSHHGTREWGSPVTPQTPEAFTLHSLDNLDAKLWAFQKAVAEPTGGEGNWSEYSPMLRGRVYKGRRHIPEPEPVEATPPVELRRPDRMPPVVPGAALA